MEFLRYEVYLVNLDQIRTFDKQRLIKKIDTITKSTQLKMHKVLNEMFAP